MRRFIMGWKELGYARRFGAEVVNYADDYVILGKGRAEEMYKAMRGLMEHLRLVVNEEKTRCLRSPEEAFEFLGYRVGKNYRRITGQGYIGTRPSKGSVQSICRKISELTEARYGLLKEEETVKRLNRVINGWGNYFRLGQVSPAYGAVDRHAVRRLRQWLCRKHKIRAGKYARYPDKPLILRVVVAFFDFSVLQKFKFLKN